MALPYTNASSYVIFNYPQANYVCPSTAYLSSQEIVETAAGQKVKMDYCPQYSNVNNLITAGLIKLQASQNETNALLKLGNVTFLGE